MINSFEQLANTKENDLQRVKNDLDEILLINQERESLCNDVFYRKDSLGQNKKIKGVALPEQGQQNLSGQLGELLNKIDFCPEEDGEKIKIYMEKLFISYFGINNNIKVDVPDRAEKIWENILVNNRKVMGDRMCVLSALFRAGINVELEDVDSGKHSEIDMENVKKKLDRILESEDREDLLKEKLYAKDGVLGKSKLKSLTFTEDSFDEYDKYNGENTIEQIKYLEKELCIFLKRSENYVWQNLAGCNGVKPETSEWYSKIVEKTDTDLDAILAKYYGKDFPLEIEVSYREWHWNERGAANIKINGNQIVYIGFDLDNGCFPEEDVELDDLAEIFLLKMGVESGLEHIDSGNKKQNTEDAREAAIDYSI